MLKSQKIAFCGRFVRPHNQDALKKLVQSNGGEVVECGAEDCTYLISTTAEAQKPGGKVVKAAEASSTVKVVDASWLVKSVERSEILDTAAYALDVVAPGAAATADDDDAADRGTDAGAKRKRAGTAATETKAPAEDVDEKKPAAKRSRGMIKATEVKVAQPQKAPGRGTSSLRRVAAQLLHVGLGIARGRRRFLLLSSRASSTNKTKVAKAKNAPVDEDCPLKGSHHIYIDDDGVVYDAVLNQTDTKNNNNKFYYVQILELSPGKPYCVWTHWGRVGENGQNKLEQNLTFEKAQTAFFKKFKDKTGLTWETRKKPPKAGKYTMIEKDYMDDDEPEKEQVDPSATSSSGMKAKQKIPSPPPPPPPPPSQLLPQVQDLVKFVFNIQTMKNSMASMNYNANKLPLGKLSKATLDKGYLALKELGQVISDPKLSQSKYKVMSVDDVYHELTSKYYSIIPHDFGRRKPVVITDENLLKAEIQLIESLGNMEIATEIMKGTSTEPPVDADGTPINILDAQFRSLNLEEATPLDKTSREFKYLQGYFNHSKADGVTAMAEIEEIYRIRRAGEFERFEADGFDADGMMMMKKKKGVSKVGDGRKLLWHGSRGCNYSGILSQGLRIAPPEAPANGYAFGKGIYLADRACKSGHYCDPWTSNNVGLLLLTEVQCGDPVYLKNNHEYSACESMRKRGLLSTKMMVDRQNDPAKWMDAEEVSPDMKGAMMPDPDTPLPQLRGFENEYIVYSVNQVKIRYIYKLKWGDQRPHWSIF